MVSFEMLSITKRIASFSNVCAAVIDALYWNLLNPRMTSGSEHIITITSVAGPFPIRESPLLDKGELVQVEMVAVTTEKSSEKLPESSSGKLARDLAWRWLPWASHGWPLPVGICVNVCQTW